tara:strand:- start:105 stop:482 length:378 start_codon:yes stop_codon:yes gene_type:complete
MGGLALRQPFVGKEKSVLGRPLLGGWRVLILLAELITPRLRRSMDGLKLSFPATLVGERASSPLEVALLCCLDFELHPRKRQKRAVVFLSKVKKRRGFEDGECSKRIKQAVIISVIIGFSRSKTS